jgi:hypothetical protein
MPESKCHALKMSSGHEPKSIRPLELSWYRLNAATFYSTSVNVPNFFSRSVFG